MPQPTRKQVCHALAESMRQFGYPDCTNEMAGEVLDAYIEDADGDLPHDVIGQFMKAQLDELVEHKVDLISLKS